jgi:hypothetical protein
MLQRSLRPIPSLARFGTEVNVQPGFCRALGPVGSAALWAGGLKAKSNEERVVDKRLSSTGRLIQRTTTMHGEDDQIRLPNYRSTVGQAFETRHSEVLPWLAARDADYACRPDQCRAARVRSAAKGGTSRLKRTWGAGCPRSRGAPTGVKETSLALNVDHPSRLRSVRPRARHKSAGFAGKHVEGFSKVPGTSLRRVEA